MKISSPVCSGSGAFIVHKMLSAGIDNYYLYPYSPYWELFPPAISGFGEKNADITHASIDYACFSKRKNIPLVSTVHGYMLDEQVNKYSGIIRYLHYKTDLKYFINKSISMSDKVICVSFYLKNKIISELNYHGDIEVIPNGIDIHKFKPETKYKSDSKIRLLFVGNLREAKGIHVFPAMLDLLGDRYELLYTSGLKNNKTVIKHKNARCVGLIKHEDMPALYAAADILVSPSIREGFGLAIAEAMSCGLPIIAANNSAIPELVDNHKGGYLCDEISSESFASNVFQLADNTDARLVMGNYNREKAVDNYSVITMVDQYRDVFEKTLSV